MQLLDILLSIGVISILTAFIYIGRKLQLLDDLRRDIDDNVKPDLKDIRERFSTLEGKTANFMGTSSPINLTEAGDNFLESSGLKKYIDDNFENLYKECCEIRDLDTAYDVQESAFELFDNIEFPDKVEDKIKNFAFKKGTSFDVARRIGSIYFRDLVLDKLDKNIEDIDGE